MSTELVRLDRFEVIRRTRGWWMANASDQVDQFVVEGLKPERVTGCCAMGVEGHPELNGEPCTVEAYDAANANCVPRQMSVRRSSFSCIILLTRAGIRRMRHTRALVLRAARHECADMPSEFAIALFVHT